MEGYGNENPGAFQPTRPLRGATANAGNWTITDEGFQPTRPLRGATRLGSNWLWDLRDFNPRAPCGARRHKHILLAA